MFKHILPEASGAWRLRVTLTKRAIRSPDNKLFIPSFDTGKTYDSQFIAVGIIVNNSKDNWRYGGHLSQVFKFRSSGYNNTNKAFYHSYDLLINDITIINLSLLVDDEYRLYYFPPTYFINCKIQVWEYVGVQSDLIDFNIIDQKLDKICLKIDQLFIPSENPPQPTEPELEPTTIITTDLVGQWILNNSTKDSSPSGRNDNSGQLNGLTQFISNDDFGHVLRFDGGSMVIPNTEDINLGNHAKRTVSVWVNADSTQPRQMIFEEGGTLRGLNIYLDEGKIYFGGWNEPDSESAWKGTFLNADITQGWHLATLTLDANLWRFATEKDTFKAYLDGELIGSGDGSQLWGHGDPTAFGAVVGSTLFHTGSGSTGSYLTGEIAKPKIFNRVLSATEIQNLYKNFS